MARRRLRGLYDRVAVRAMSDALYERLIDDCWDELKAVFDRPDIREAEAKIMRAIAEAFSPNGGTNGRRRRKKKA